MADRYLATIPISQLVDHPQNSKVFGNAVDQELADSIEQLGVLTPLVVAALASSKYRIISGHRRKYAAESLNIAELPCLVRQTLTDPLDIDDAWTEANIQREMTNEQKARWYALRKRVETLKAEKRIKAGTDPRENFPQGSETLENKGKASDIAAKDVGWSGKTADAAEDVVEAIDAAEESGDTETAAELRETLNTKSVNAAAQKVKPPKAKTSPRVLIEAIEKDAGLLTRTLMKAAEQHGRGKPYKTIMQSIEDIKTACQSWKV